MTDEPTGQQILDTPWEELAAAADKLERMANWFVETSDQEIRTVVAELETFNERADARWIALMSPALAQHVVSLLRAAAKLWKRWHTNDTPEPGSVATGVLAVARHINGSAMATDDPAGIGDYPDGPYRVGRHRPDNVYIRRPDGTEDRFATTYGANDGQFVVDALNAWWVHGHEPPSVVEESP